MASPTEMRAQVLELIEWCNTHNDGELLRHHCKEHAGGSSDKHKVVRGTYRFIKGVVGGPRSAEYADSIALMDHHFGTAWRPGMGGTWALEWTSEAL